MRQNLAYKTGQEGRDFCPDEKDWHWFSWYGLFVYSWSFPTDDQLDEMENLAWTLEQQEDWPDWEDQYSNWEDQYPPEDEGEYVRRKRVERWPDLFHRGWKTCGGPNNGFN